MHPGQSCFLSEFFSVVQQRAPSFRHRLVDASHGSLWPSGKRLAATPECARCCLPTSPGALRTKRSHTTGSSQRGLDQQAGPTHMKSSINSVSTCLKVVDTRRNCEGVICFQRSEDIDISSALFYFELIAVHKRVTIFYSTTFTPISIAPDSGVYGTELQRKGAVYSIKPKS